MNWFNWDLTINNICYNTLEYKMFPQFHNLCYSIIYPELKSNINQNYQKNKKFITLINQLFINNKQRYYGTV